MRRNRLAKAVSEAPHIATKVSEGLYHRLTRLTVASAEDLCVVTHNRLVAMNAVRRRHETGYGRVLNWLLREDPAHVEINGVELTALLQYTEETADIAIAWSSKQLYLVPYDAVERLHIKLRELVARSS